MKNSSRDFTTVGFDLDPRREIRRLECSFKAQRHWSKDGRFWREHHGLIKCRFLVQPSAATKLRADILLFVEKTSCVIQPRPLSTQSNHFSMVVSVP
jgi:hypothetical protein